MKTLPLIALSMLLLFGCNNSSSSSSPGFVPLGHQSFDVPTDFPSIQQAIDAISYGGIVNVAPGIYHENIDFKGKAIVVQSTQGPWLTAIDGQQAGPVVSFINHEGQGSVIQGFTIQNGQAPAGGGIYCLESSPSIKGNVIVYNHGKVGGGGLSFSKSSPRVEDNILAHNSSDACGGGVSLSNSNGIFLNNIVRFNQSEYHGGGFFISKSSPEIRNNLVEGNRTKDLGGGFYCVHSAFPTLFNCTIIKNRADGFGGGLCIYENAIPKLKDSIIADNQAGAGNAFCIYHVGPGGIVPIHTSIELDHSCLKGGLNEACFIIGGLTLDSSIVTADPEFVTGPKGYYYLSQTSAGQATDSPCVDTGGSNALQAGMDQFWTRTDQTLDTGVVDMGFHYSPKLQTRLQADCMEILASSGGQATFLLNGNPSRDYILLVTSSGTQPGTVLPNGNLVLPLNWDLVTNLCIQLANTPVLPNFIGVLGPEGTAQAQMLFGPISNLPPMELHFAFALIQSWDFVSNPIPIQLLP